jgi:hypothetical protein
MVRFMRWLARLIWWSIVVIFLFMVLVYVLVA